MSEPTSVTVPHEIVNDDLVTLVAWHVLNGDQVVAGQALFEIETSKAVVIVEAEHGGYIERLGAVGSQVAVGGQVARLHQAPLSSEAQEARVDEEEGAAVSNEQRISRRARKVMSERGLDVEIFRDLTLVREADVLDYLAKGKLEQGKALAVGKAVRADEPLQSVPADRGLFHDFRSTAKDRGHGLLRVACNYLFRNYFLGLLTRVAPRGIILPLHRLRGVKMGKNCFIDPTAIVETAYPENITIGNDVRITAGAVIMTHIKGPHYLRENGYVPLVLRKVVLEDHSFIGVNAVIMPGVTVGKAAVVASGSVVMNNVPPYTMVGGNPARVMKRLTASESESSRKRQ